MTSDDPGLQTTEIYTIPARWTSVHADLPFGTEVCPCRESFQAFLLARLRDSCLFSKSELSCNTGREGGDQCLHWACCSYQLKAHRTRKVTYNKIRLISILLLCYVFYSNTPNSCLLCERQWRLGCADKGYRGVDASTRATEVTQSYTLLYTTVIRGCDWQRKQRNAYVCIQKELVSRQFR
jgi:hypothetical protein